MQGIPSLSEAAQDSRPTVLNDVKVRYEGRKRIVSCFCGQEVNRSIVPHMKREHSEVWLQWVQNFVYLRSIGFPLKKIMRLYRAGNGPLLFSWTVVEREIRKAIESGTLVLTPTPSKKIDRWQPNDFKLAKGTVWDFPKRGDWAVHTSDYRGNWPPQLARNLILKFTQPGDLIIDAFAGGGTTLIESWLCNRRSVGVDVSKLALQVTKAKLAEMRVLSTEDCRVYLPDEYEPIILDGNSLELEKLVEVHNIHIDSVQLICAHPPYLDSIKYTQNDDRDISITKEPTMYYQKMRKFAYHAYRLLKTDGVCALLIGDIRKNGHLIPLGINTVDLFQRQGFLLENIIIKTQNGERSTEFYLTHDNYLLEHEYLFILRKRSQKK